MIRSKIFKADQTVRGIFITLSKISKGSVFFHQGVKNCVTYECSTQDTGTHPGRGGTPIWNRQGCSSEILNLTSKGDHLGVAQAYCDP